LKSKNINKKNYFIELSVFLLVFSIVISFRYLILHKFGFIYTDSDQAIMWNGLVDFSHGIFHEPRFYGQSYNTMLEALLAVPFYKFGIPVYKALPLITSILTLLPYLLISIIVFKKRQFYLSIVILTIPLLLPTEYALITSLSRGFVTGIFVTTLGMVSIYSPKKKKSFFFFGLFMVLGFSVNANSVIISLPFLLYLFLLNYKNKYFYLFTGLGILISASLHFWVNSFYLNHPAYNFHKISLFFSFNQLISNLGRIDKHLNYVTPIFWKQGFIILILFLIVAIFFLIKKKFVQGLVFFSIPFIILFTLGLNKIDNGVNSIFFSYSRMYLGLPVLIAFCLSLFKTNSKLLIIYFIIPLLFVSIKIANLQSSIIRNVNPNKYHAIAVAKVANVISTCKTINSVCINNNVDIVIVVDSFYYDFIDYGCSACVNDFPNTLRPVYERRTWRLLEDENRVYKNILLIDNKHSLNKQSLITLKNTELGYIIINNKLKTMDLLKKLNIKARAYK